MKEVKHQIFISKGILQNAECRMSHLTPAPSPRSSPVWKAHSKWGKFFKGRCEDSLVLKRRGRHSNQNPWRIFFLNCRYLLELMAHLRNLLWILLSLAMMTTKRFNCKMCPLTFSVQLVVHSLKDLPSTLPPGMLIGAVFK